MTDKRIIYYDVLKAIGIFGVLAIHTLSDTFTAYDFSGGEYWFSMFFACLMRFAVPIFVMVSGGLFLSREIPVRKLYSGYILRLAVALIVFSVLYEAAPLFSNLLETGIWDMSIIKTGIKNLLTFNTHYHLYYLYIIILLYALSPVVKTFLKSASQKKELYFIGILFAFASVLPFVRSFYPFSETGGMISQYQINFTYGMLLYFVLGHYLSRYKVNPRLMGFLGIVSFGVVFLGTVLLSKKYSSPFTLFIDSNNPFIVFMSVSVFTTVKKYFNEIKSKRISDFFVFISKSSFFVYLVHDFINILLNKAGFTIINFSVYYVFILRVLICYVISALIYFVLSKIQGINKFI